MTGATDPFIETSDLTVTQDDQVAWATARIREYCRWHIYPSLTVTLALSTDGGHDLLLPTLHLTALSSIAWTDTNTARTAIDRDDLEPIDDGLPSDTGILRWKYQWPYGINNVTVTFTHGYDTLPEALREVAVSIAKRYPAQMSQAQQAQAGGVLMTYGAPLAGGFTGAGLTYAEQMVLDKYRIVNQP